MIKADNTLRKAVSVAEGMTQVRVRGWKALSYTTRVTVAFALIAAMTAIVAIGVISFVWDKHFQTYTRDNLEIAASSVAERIADRYVQEGGWSTSTTAVAAYVGIMYPGVGVVVVDGEGTIKFDSTRTVEGPTGTFQQSLAPSSESQMATAPIAVGDEVVGSVRVWVYGSDVLLRQGDIEFRNNSYSAMVFAAFVAIVLASCIGFLFARNLVRPINQMMKTAKAVKEGDYSARTGLRGDDEVARLGETFDAMVDSVENDRELERRLTTDVAHELRTPLMAIQATVEAMVDGVMEVNEKQLETVNSEVQHLSRMVNALLKLSRLENRANAMKQDVVDVGELVSSIIATHEAFVAESGLELKFESQEGVLVKGDGDLIRQAAANLLSNAVRYTPEGGTITVRVRRGEIMAAIVVEDTGIGLTPEEAKMVFSRFWRADAGRTRESGGLGIGLSVVKEIVSRHGGWVQVEGRKGEGARFTIHIPLYEPDRKSKDRDKAQRQQKVPRQQKPQKAKKKR